ncbi:unnamed protein product [Rotaria sp. Silwood2]|nr:unnamed protein product [Rotaria sp. Silwood2]
MDDFTESAARQHHTNKSIHAILQKQLEQLLQQLPESLTKPIYAIDAVDGSINNQFEERLQQERKSHAGKRIILIPYNLENSHWVGILIEFETDEQIQRADYIDSIKQSNIIPYKLQMQFTNVYADAILQAKNLRKQDDPNESAELMIDNLLTAAIDLIINDPKDRYIHRTASSKREDTKPILLELVQKLTSGLENCAIEDVRKLPDAIADIRKKIEKYEKKDKSKEIEKHKIYLTTLNELALLANEIATILKADTTTDETKLQYLEQRLDRGLAKWKIQNITMIYEKIQETENKILQYERSWRKKDAERKKEQLNELKELLELSKMIDSLKSCVILNEEKQKQEDPKTLDQDLANMPSCAEKMVMELLEYCERRLLEDCTNSKNEDEADRLFTHLQDQMKRQDMFTDEIRFTLQDINRFIHSNNILSAVRLLRELLRKIRPLNLQQIQRLLTKAEHAATLMRDKEIILFVGATGTGKSTTAQFLAGSKMKKIQVQVTSEIVLEHIMVVESTKHPDLNNLISNSQKKCETHCIIPVTVQLKDIFGPNEVGELTICDTLGFCDTIGPEVDVANSTAVLEAFQKCKSIKILAFSSYASLGNKGRGIQKLAHMLISMLPGIEDRLDAIFYVFTKYPETTNITNLLESIKTLQVDEDSSLRWDTAFIKILSDMIEKTKKGAYKLDPVHGDPKVLIRELQRLRGILRPGEIFRYPMREETQKTVMNQVNRYKMNIICALKHKDITLLIYYVNSLKTLKDLTKKSSVRDAYEDSIDFISKNLEEYSKEVMNKLNRTLTSCDGLREEDIVNYKTCIEYIQTVQGLRAHLGSKLISTATLMQNIHSELQQRSLALTEEPLTSPLVGMHLHNLLLLKNSFQELQPQYNQNCKDFEERYEKLIQTAPKLISINDFQAVAETILTISQSSSILKDHLGEYVEDKYCDIIKLLLRHLSSFSEKVVPLLEKIQLNDNDLEILKNCFSILISAKENSALQDRISTYVEKLKKKSRMLDEYEYSSHRISEDTVQDINAIYDGFIEKFIRHFDEINQRIKEYLEKDRDYALEYIEKLVIQMEILRTMPEVESKTAGTYFRTVEKIRGYVQELQKTAEQFLISIDNQTGIISFMHFARSLSRLENAQWINRINPGMYDTLMQRITEDLMRYAQQLEDRLIKLDLTLKHPDNISIAQEILVKIESMTVFECIIPQLQTCRKRVFEHFYRSTQRTFDHIQKTFNLQDETVYKIKQELKELEQIKHEYNNLHPARVYLRKQAYPDLNTLDREIAPLKNDDYLKERGHSIRKEYHSLMTSHVSMSPEEMSFLQEKGFQSVDLLDRIIQEKKKMIVEREKNKQRYDFNDRLDVSTVNNAIVYLNKCENVSHVCVNEIATDTIRILQDYIGEYSNFLNKEISASFQQACSIDAEGDRLQYSYDLQMRLQELATLSRYTHVFECIDGVEKLAYWHQRFLQYYHTLSYNMEQSRASNRSQDLKSQLNIAQTLSCLDKVCGDVLGNVGFQSLYRQYQNKVDEEIREAYRIVLDYISKRDYANVDMILRGINISSLNPRDLAQIQHDLSNSLNVLMKNIRSIVHWLDGKIERENNRSQIKEIKDNIEKIGIAVSKTNIMELLDSGTQNSFRKFENEINELLSRIIIRGLDVIEAFLNVDSFDEAKQIMENLSWVQHELADHYTSSLVIEKTNELRKRFDDIVVAILKRYDFTDIDNYSVNPPKDLLAKLKTAASRGDVQFHQAYISMLGNIRESFSQAIDQVRSASLNERPKKIRSFKNALCFLPDELQNTFKLQIDELGNSFMDEEKTHKRDLDEVLRRTDDDDRTIKKIAGFAQRYKDQNMHELFEILRAEISRRLYDYQIDVETSLNRQDMQSAIDIVKKIILYRDSIDSYFPEVVGIYKNVRDLIGKHFSHCADTLTNIATIEQCQIVEKAFSNMIICIDFSMTLGTKDKNFVPDNVLQNGCKKFQNMCEYIDENSKNYRLAISKMNVIELRQVLIVAKQWDVLVRNIRQWRPQHSSMEKYLQGITNVILHADMIIELERAINNLIVQLNVDLISDETTRFERRREEFFSHLMILISTLRNINSKLKDLLPFKLDIEKLEEEIKRKVKRLGDQLLSIASKSDLSQRDSDKFRTYYNHLSSFNRHIILSDFDVRHVLDAAEEKIFETIASLSRETGNSGLDVAKVAELLIKMKFFAENLLMFDSKINAEIDEILKNYKIKVGTKAFMKLPIALEKTDIGARLIVEHASLAGEDWRRRREKMQKQDDIEYMLRELDGDDIATDILRIQYYNFRKTYDSLIARHLELLDQMSNTEPNLDILISETKLIVGTIVQKHRNSVRWNNSFKKKISDLLAHIFAVWTLKNTQHYNAMRGIEAAQAYLLMPHVGQVIAIFRILGIGYQGYDDLLNNLVQIGTGEGKSVVMAVTACVFALIGVDVNCSCYSEVLSMRDKNDFAPVFRALGIEERIEYGTFNRLCENLLNEQCNVRDKVCEMIVNNSSTIDVATKSVRIDPKVLLIDEVDVFLSEKFYGGTYSPSVYIKDSTINILLDTIWKNKTIQNLNVVKNTQAYKACATRFSNWIFLFDEAIKDMLIALESFQSSTYIVQNDRIVYVEGESIVDNVVHGYSTIWAYYHEHEKDNISKVSLETNVGIIVNCGTFSYAEMPHEFAYITGVTGTLKTLAMSEQNILRRVYNVEKKTFIPSVFGSSNRMFNSNTDVLVVKESEYYMALRGDMDVVCRAGRAILVFFESDEKLMDFYNSSQLSSIKTDVQIITEKVSVKERELCIKRAALEGRITLLTRTFGRGTDFICRNQQLLANGGIHVLQTFFSEELSEEYQIMGRGARQGDRGSYRMILLDKELEWILGSTWEDDLPKIIGSNLYKNLNKARNDLYESRCGAKELSIEQCRQEHEASKSFMSSLISGNIEAVKTFLKNQNQGASFVSGSSRTVLLLDATGSMSSLLSATKETVCTMFERASNILKEKNLSDLFQMQIVIYRNYNSRENEILQASAWETKPNNLRSFMNTVGPKGGMGAEAIEIGLWHAVKESETLDSISQVILIGDAPANSQEEVRKKRAGFGEAYWEKTRFGKPTYFAYELEKLKSKNLPVHAFYLTRYAKDNFKYIANETGGRCERLNIHSPEGAETLTDFVTEEVLRKAAGDQGDAAVDLYRKIYKTFAF